MKMEHREPDGLIIWTPGDGQAHGVGVFQHDAKWTYSKPALFPEHELNAFLRERLEAGALGFDCRMQARWKHPGMEAAIPVLVAQGIPLAEVIEAYKVLHSAIMELPDDV